MPTLPDIATALDGPDSVFDAQEQNFVQQIGTKGWFCTEVFAEDEAPGFSFTPGFWVSTGFPEVIVFSMPSKIVHDVLWDIYHMAAGGSPHPIGAVTASVFGNPNALLMPVGKQYYEAYLGWRRWFYGNDDFPCVQLLWPDRNGIFPRVAGTHESINRAQPVLSGGPPEMY